LGTPVGAESASGLGAAIGVVLGSALRGPSGESLGILLGVSVGSAEGYLVASSLGVLLGWSVIVIGRFDAVINGDVVGIATGALGILVRLFLGAEAGYTGVLLGDGAGCTEGNCDPDGLACEGGTAGAMIGGRERLKKILARCWNENLALLLVLTTGKRPHG
jgi:hypothetical protein